MKLILSESQLEMLIGHIQETDSTKNNKKVLEEGWKEVVLGTAMLMGVGLTGVNAQTANDALNDSNILQKIEATLESDNILKLVDTLENAGLGDAMNKIQANSDKIKQNFETAAKKKNLHLNLDIYNTGSEKSVERKIKQGYAVSDIDVSQDTVWTAQDNVAISTTVEMDFGSNIFKTASFDLSEETSAEIKATIEGILSMGGTITSIEIVSSTDTEPIKMGNEKLSKLRANSIKTFIDGMNIDTEYDIKTLPNQGPDVYDKSMSPQERKAARDSTAEYRYVKVKINSVVQPQPSGDEKAYKIIEKVNYELVRTNVLGKAGTSKGGSKTTSKKTFKCNKVKVNKKTFSCDVFTK